MLYLRDSTHQYVGDRKCFPVVLLGIINLPRMHGGNARVEHPYFGMTCGLNQRGKDLLASDVQSTNIWDVETSVRQAILSSEGSKLKIRPQPRTHHLKYRKLLHTSASL